MQGNLNPELPSNVATLGVEEDKISATVAVSKTLEDYENQKVVFSFVVYNNNQSEIASLDKKEAKKLTKELKKISLTLTKHLRHQHASGIACKPVSNSGSYSSLFTDIPEDIELLEVDYSSAGRVFGYMVSNIFNVVAVAKKHK